MSGLINVIRKGAKKPIQLFSRVDEAAQELPRSKGTGKEFMAELKKQPGVKKAELDDRKLAELESAPKMTKQEFIDKLKEKPAAKIEEDIKSNPTDVDLDEKAMELIEQKADEMAEREFGKISRFNRQEWNEYQEGAVAYLKDREYDKYLREAKRDIEENGGVSFPKFTDPTLRLPGGENYREILLRLPPSQDPRQIAAKAVEEAQSAYSANKSSENYSRLVEARKKADEIGADWETSQYRSKHWDEPNVLAHMRVQDRVGPNGEKILHVEEIQSDWHQAGRQQGYKGQSGDERLASVAKPMNGYFEVLDQNGNFIANVMNHDLPAATPEAAIAEAQRRIQSPRIGHQADDPRVPDAPFKKNWHELATKKLMNYAIENGYDKVAFTPAVEQVRRYEDATRKVVDEIAYNPSTGYFTAMKDGRVVNNQKMDPETLERTVGKQTAQNLLASEPNNIGVVSMKSKDMTIGGELYKNLYDRDIVNFLNKEYGPHGVKVGQINIRTGEEPSSNRWAVVMDADNNYRIQDTMSDRFAEPEKFLTKDEVQAAINAKQFGTTLHSIDITPQMREVIQAKGQPLYQAVGVGLTGAASAPKEEVQFSDNPDTMMMEMEDRGFAGGGLLKKAAKAIKGAQEILPAAEREENLQKFLSHSRIREPLYHATPKNFKEFKLGGDDPTLSGPAIWLTPSKEHQPAAHNIGGGQRGFKEGTNVMPVHVQARSPLMLDDKDSIEWAREVYAGGNREFPDLLAPKWIEELKKEGYDSIIHADPYGNRGGQHEVIMFHPERIKSAIGNRGTYDITDPDINKAQGGLTKAKRK